MLEFENTDFAARVLGLNLNLKWKHAVLCEVSVIVLIYGCCHFGARIKPFFPLPSEEKLHFSLKLSWKMPIFFFLARNRMFFAILYTTENPKINDYLAYCSCWQHPILKCRLNSDWDTNPVHYSNGVLWNQCTPTLERLMNNFFSKSKVGYIAWSVQSNSQKNGINELVLFNKSKTQSKFNVFWFINEYFCSF